MIKTNIKMRVTPEQSAKVQEICSSVKMQVNNCISKIGENHFLYVFDDRLGYDYMISEDNFYNNYSNIQEIDPELFIRTNGSCIDEFGIDNTIDINRKPIQYQIGIDTFQRAKANLTKDELIACIKFNIDKYNWRKKGQDIEDFKKIIDYANFAIEVLKGEK